MEDDEEPIDDWSPRDSPLTTPTSTIGTPRTPTPGVDGKGENEDDGAEGGLHMAQTAAHILQMAKIQRSRREDALRHRETLDAMRRKVTAAKEDLRMERDEARVRAEARFGRGGRVHVPHETVAGIHAGHLPNMVQLKAQADHVELGEGAGPRVQAAPVRAGDVD